MAAHYRTSLPQLGEDLFLADGGIETSLIFLHGQDLPHFATFPLLETAQGTALLRDYYRSYAELARSFDAGFILEAPTWRANADWGARLGYDDIALAEANRRSIRFLEEIRTSFRGPGKPMLLSGCIGPRGDGYRPEALMSEKEAEQYHRTQIQTFATTSADMVTAVTINYVEEAIGIVRAAGKAEMPVAISFTVETDGNLPTTQTLGDAIREVDRATADGAAYFMINCAHPSHFAHALPGSAPWSARIRGLRANASRMSHAELDQACQLDSGDPAELARLYREVKLGKLAHLSVLGGCCGTDHRHIREIARVCRPLFP